ncbi:MAG: hypothetical protein CL484_12580 [Acidobacteria bacterium]|nr:hypothetical protein [Acidobacteriota bacterium]|tara:strand:+ start:2445 stop:3464 length:1020 start_codon:yes stop_codon:yes gene_type:complete
MSAKISGNKEREARRCQVWEMLKQVNDEKAVQARATTLLDQAESTYRTATKPTWIVGPLRHIAAYRLAHLLLRLSAPDLKRVNCLFEVASEFPRLSALTQIYRVAVLERLLKMEPNETLRKELERTRQEAFDRARRELVRADPFSAADREDVLGKRLQGGLFNMLELTSYFTGLPYDGLEGRGSRLDDALDRGDWVIVGPEPETGRVHMSEATAKHELEDRARQSSGGEVFFRLGSTINDWKVPSEQQYSVRHRQQLKILALLCSAQGIEDEHALKQRVLSPQQGDDDYRQYKHRLKTGLNDLLGRADGELYDASSGRGGLRLSGDYVVYGAVKLEHIV